MKLQSVTVAAFLWLHTNFSGSYAFLTHQNGIVQRTRVNNNHNNIISGDQCRSFVGHHRMVSTSSSSSNSENVVKEKEKKPLDIMYPTKRGMTVDSREIIASGLARQNLRAIRLKHILFASEELAEASLSRVRSSELTFEELAQQISNCAETREHGGEVGWVNVDGFFSNLHISTNNDDDTNHYNKDTSNEHLDAILPEQARFQTLQLSTKVCTLFLPFFLFKIVLTMITTIFVHSHKIMFKKKIIMK